MVHPFLWDIFMYGDVICKWVSFVEKKIMVCLSKVDNREDVCRSKHLRCLLGSTTYNLLAAIS